MEFLLWRNLTVNFNCFSVYKMNFLHTLQQSSHSCAVKVTFELSNFNFSPSSHCSFWHSLSLICNDAGNYKPQCNLSTMQEWCWIFHSDSLERLDNGKSTWMGWRNQFVTDLGSFFTSPWCNHFPCPTVNLELEPKGMRLTFLNLLIPPASFSLSPIVMILTMISAFAVVSFNWESR